MTDTLITRLNRYSNTKEIQMNSSSNLLVLGVTGQVGKLVAANLRRRKANLLVGTRSWKSSQIDLERRALSISMIHELSIRH